jgi:DNA polymerase-3 subunit delta
VSSEGQTGADLPPVTYFHGEDRFMMEKEVEKCIEAFSDEEARPFDLEILHADEVEPEEVAASANRLPVMSPRRLVVLKRMEKWKWNFISELTDTYLSDPSPDTCLILCYGAKPERKKKYIKNLEKAAGLSRSFTPTGDRQLVTWVEHYFQKRGMALGPGAAETLIEYLGADLHRLQAELVKVELFHAGSEEPVTVDRLEELLQRTASESVFALPPLLAQGEKQEALKLLGRLMGSGEEPIPLLGLIAGHYRRLMAVRAALEEDGSESRLPGALGLPPWLARKLLDDVRRLDDHRLAESFPNMAWADAHLKRTDRTMAQVVMIALAARLLG